MEKVELNQKILHLSVRQNYFSVSQKLAWIPCIPYLSLKISIFS